MKKRKDGRYAKQVTIGIKDGKPIKKTVYGKTIKEVEKNHRELMSLIDKGIIIEDNNITLLELWDEWYRVTKKNEISIGTQQCYDTFRNAIEANIGSVKIKSVTKYTIESFLESYIKQDKKATAYRLLQHIKAMFEYAITIDLVYKNPCRGIVISCKRKKKRILTELELKRIEKAALTAEEKAFIYILRYTGMRRNEALALTKEDIDFQNNLISINKTVIDNKGASFVKYQTKTEAGSRMIPIFEPLSDVLASYIESIDHDMLFQNRNGKPYSSNSLYRMFKKIREKTSLPDDITCHSFRHTFITECYQAGIDVKKLQQWIGHCDVHTTLNIYTHLENKVIEDATAMNEYYANNKTEVKRKSNHILMA